MEIVEIIENFNIWLEEFLLNAGILAPLLCTLLIFLEGILAFLPLFVFKDNKRPHNVTNYFNTFIS